jgi:hypothetical protein
VVESEAVKLNLSDLRKRCLDIQDLRIAVYSVRVNDFNARIG